MSEIIKEQFVLLLLIWCLILNLTITASEKSSAPSVLISKIQFALANEKNPSPELCQLVSKSDICPNTKFSQLSGECNNLAHKSWGSSGDTFTRLLNPEYSDGISAPRISSEFLYLPDEETLTKKLVAKIPSKISNHVLNYFFPAWGLLIAHDIAETTTTKTSINCCSSNFTKEVDAECFVQSKNCKDYKRSSPVINEQNCLEFQREQMNLATSFLDGSSIYQPNTNTNFANKNGTIDIDKCSMCQNSGIVGDLHRMLVREHNKIAKELSELNEHWTNEQIFFQTRQIIIALIQHITYNEYLPLLMEESIISKYGLRPKRNIFFMEYADKIKPGTFNEFAIVAFSAFHSKFQEFPEKYLIATETYIDTPIEDFNIEKKYSNDFTYFGYGIHEGRDHGIPAHKNYLNLCNDQQFSLDITYTSYDDMQQLLNISIEHIQKLKSLYKNANDIDLLVGSILESPLPGSVFGPTLTCILALQFQNLKYTDRFWYENSVSSNSFTKDQLRMIRKFTMSKLLCDTLNITEVQPTGFFRHIKDVNKKIPCNEIDALELEYWKETEQSDSSYDNTEDISESDYNINTNIISEAIRRAEGNALIRKKFEYDSWLINGGIDAKSPDGTAASFSKANKKALLIANSSLIYELTSNELINSLKLLNRRKRQIERAIDVFDQNHVIETLQTLDVSRFISQRISNANIDNHCEDLTIPCNANAPFRSISGRCNNLENTNWGQSLTVFSRLLPPQYEDGISRPRFTSVSGSPLPNPRTISTLVHPDISNLHTRFSLMVMQYAQFLDHDLTLTPIHKGFHESIPSCRKCNSPQTVHPECNPFPVPSGDHYYPEVNITSGEQLCFPFMRSLPGQQNLGPRDQINQNTAFLDGSQIYGENNCVASKLRGFSGRLNSTLHPSKGKELLPQSPSHPECKSPSGLCFIGGDDRASEQPGLTAIHTIFLREHNRIVEGLRGVNPHWNGDQLYENARKIVVAQNQHITFNEFLPRILSWNAVNLYGLKLLQQGYYTDYNPTCNPAVFNEFAAAAFRIGHSLLRPHIPRLNSNHHPVDPPLLLRDGFFKVDALLQPGIIDEISRGLVATPMETLDQFITGEVTNHLFEDRRIPFSGLDLIALNIQRGRDHGLPSYNNYRALCNLKRARAWQDLNREIPPEVIARLRKIYQSVEDIDLFPGAMTERPLQGGLVGPTLACIIGIQFRQLRKCDRFWYENNGLGSKFTEAQLVELRKTTLSKIVCENLEIQGDMQRAAFDLPTNFLNPRVSCQSMPQIDLGKWRENIQECDINGRIVKLGESSLPSPCTSCVCTIEGPQCASLRVTDCLQLEKQWTREEIKNDEICNSQCGDFLQSSSYTSPVIGLTPPSARITRSRFDSSFRFPDLTKFIAPL